MIDGQGLFWNEEFKSIWDFWEIESEVITGYSYTFGLINTKDVCVNRAKQSFIA